MEMPESDRNSLVLATGTDLGLAVLQVSPLASKGDQGGRSSGGDSRIGIISLAPTWSRIFRRTPEFTHGVHRVGKCLALTRRRMLKGIFDLIHDGILGVLNALRQIVLVGFVGRDFNQVFPVQLTAGMQWRGVAHQILLTERQARNE